MIQAVLRQFRPYVLHISLAIYTPLILFADSHLTSLTQQYVLGLITFCVLYVALRGSASYERRQVWLCVGIATCYEIFGSIIWGLYRYRFHNVPLFVPPGHGLVYLFGLTAARTPLMLNHGRLITRLALVAAGCWAVAGLTALPLVTGRLDVTGAVLLPLFAWFMLRSQRAPVFAAIFVATSGLELFGTNFGNWLWLPNSPLTHVATGNPPSVIAGGYCVIDATVLLAVRALTKMPALSRIAWQQPVPAEVAAA